MKFIVTENFRNKSSNETNYVCFVYFFVLKKKEQRRQRRKIIRWNENKWNKMTFYTINSDMFNNECFTSVINFVIIFILVEKLKN